MNGTLNVTLPYCGEKDLEKITTLYNNAIRALCNNRVSNEKRIGTLERKSMAGTGKFSSEKYVGKHYKFIEINDGGVVSLMLYFSEDGVNWPDVDDYIMTWTPPF